MTFAELQQFVEDLGEKKFRTTQLYQWMHQKMVKEFASMTNLSAAFRDKLEEQAALNGCTMVKRQISADGTNKFLMELSDGNKVESVLMNIILAIAFVYPLRWAAGWDVVFVRPR